MSYELRRDKDIGNGLRRICRKQVELALAFAKGEKETDDSPVHETRRHLKKARAALRLVKDQIGPGCFKRHDRCLRNVGRLISDLRDAEVRLATMRQLEGLTQNRRHREYAKLEEMLRLDLENFIAAFAEWHTQAIPMLRKMLDQIDAWPLDGYDCKQLRRAIQRTYKHARDALAVAEAKKTKECFHKFRTEAKRLSYQLRIIRPINPVVLKSLQGDLRALADVLGRVHDLTFLGKRFCGDGKQSEFERELLDVIDLSCSDLQRGATDLGERFFREPPCRFGKRLATWLDDWAERKSPSLAEELINQDDQRLSIG